MLPFFGPSYKQQMAKKGLNNCNFFIRELGGRELIITVMPLIIFSVGGILFI